MRFLTFSNAEEPQGVLNCGELDRYIQSIEGTVTATTQVAKLNRIKNAVEYLVMMGTPPAEAAVVTSHIKNWSSTLAKEGRRIGRIRQEERSENPPAFGDIDSFAECMELTVLFNQTVRDVQKGEKPDKSDLRTCVLWLAGTLMLVNHQRPGAVVNMTLPELKGALDRKQVQGRDTYVTVAVEHHKTGSTGRARLVARNRLADRLSRYVNHIRPQLPPSQWAFPNSNGKKLDHFSRLVRAVGERYHLKLPTATEGRHAAATAAALTLPEMTCRDIASALSHSYATQKTYYVDIHSKETAQRGFRALEELRKGQGSSSSGGVKAAGKFTQEETETIYAYFQSYVESRDIPTTEDCRVFLRNHPMGRDAKQVRDKVRTMVNDRRRSLMEER